MLLVVLNTSAQNMASGGAQHPLMLDSTFDRPAPFRHAAACAPHLRNRPAGTAWRGKIGKLDAIDGLLGH
jgi:hypothetical protein